MKSPQLDLFGDEDRRPLAAHRWPQAQNGFYVEPQWCSERLFAVEVFTDLVDRGYQHFGGCLDFLQCERPHGANLIFNPPFDRCEAFVRHAVSMISKRDKSKVATIFLQRRLNAARWLAELPLARVYLLTPRPSMPPGHVIEAGEKPKGGTQDFCWLIFRRGHKGSPELHWLHRDGDKQ
jgi:hypothetical protein